MSCSTGGKGSRFVILSHTKYEKIGLNATNGLAIYGAAKKTA